MVNARQWQSLNPLHQFKKIPQEVVRSLDKKNYSFERLYDLDAHQLGELIRNSKMGKPLYKFMRQVILNFVIIYFIDSKIGYDNFNFTNYSFNVKN